MKLKSFQVFNYRSINDSGEIDVKQITSLLGRNESGKSNLLLALYSLNPADGYKKLNEIKDFPRHHQLKECNDNTKVLSTTWDLNQEDKNKITKILPRASSVNSVIIERDYGKTRQIKFDKLDKEFYIKKIQKKLAEVLKITEKSVNSLNDTQKKSNLKKDYETFKEKTILKNSNLDWATNIKSALLNLKQAFQSMGINPTDLQEKKIASLGELADKIHSDETAQKDVYNWILKNLPIFVYLDEYPELKGHQNITEYIQHRTQNKLDDSDKNFEKLCKVAGLDPEELNKLSNQNKSEERNQLANRASAVITEKIRNLWKDRELKVRFNLDSHYMDTLISDPNSTYDVEVNLDERSRGFKWFFSFYITFSADTNGGQTEDAILLLDEPGLFLHAKSQSDLLSHLKNDFKNQIIYTTHSPFMVPTDNLSSIRTVNITEKSGTTVTNDPTGDSRTLFPLQAALGYNLVQSLFIGPNNLVVEGITDFWILSSISNYLAANSKTALDKQLILTPAGGAQKIPYMVALLTSEKLNVLVLLDEEKNTKATKDELLKSKLIKKQNIIFISEAFNSTTHNNEADIEDLLNPSIYIDLVEEIYSKDLSGKGIELNDKLNNNIPRIVKRIESVFTEVGLSFNKTRPARTFLDKMASEPDKIIDADTLERFERLFSIINNKLNKQLAQKAI